MESVPVLPLPPGELPAAIRRFGDPAAPTPARTMAAKGLVPVKGGDLVTLLCQLAADPDKAIADAAKASLEKVPEGVVEGAAADPGMHPSILDALARRFEKRVGVLERVVQNGATADRTLATLALLCDERTSELIATNQQRLLGAPAIIEALYKNKHTRMSTADRLVELAARHGVTLEGIPAFEAHVEAIKGQLIPEPTEEPLPGDLAFQAALAEDSADAEVMERDEAEGIETLKEKYKPLHMRIRDMPVSERIRMTVIGDAAARAILIRDPNKVVSRAAVQSPRMTESEAVAISYSKEVSEDVLRLISNRKEWVRNYEMKKALLLNPKTPLGVAMRFIPHMRDNDLKALSRSRNVPAPVKTAANQRLQMKQRRK